MSSRATVLFVVSMLALAAPSWAAGTPGEAPDGDTSADATADPAAPPAAGETPGVLLDSAAAPPGDELMATAPDSVEASEPAFMNPLWLGALALALLGGVAAIALSLWGRRSGLEPTDHLKPGIHMK